MVSSTLQMAFSAVLLLGAAHMESIEPSSQPKRCLRGYLAISLDGFVAKENGSLDWLDRYNSVEDLSPLYENFMTKISCVLMGRKTFDFVVNAVPNVDDIYPNKKIYVITHRELPVSDNRFTAIQGDIVQFLDKLDDSGDIYVDSPSVINQVWTHMNFVTLTICPLSLGKGIPLFQGKRHLEVVRVHTLPEHLVQIEYKVKRNEVSYVSSNV